MNQLYLKTLTGLGVGGAILVSLGFPLSANMLWSVSNPLLALHNYKIFQKEQAALFGIFTIISWFGVINLWE